MRQPDERTRVYKGYLFARYASRFLRVLAQSLGVTPDDRDALVRNVQHEVSEGDAGDFRPAAERHAFAPVKGGREGEPLSIRQAPSWRR